MKTTNPLLDESFDKILNCFAGSDGGVSFAKLRNLLEVLEKQANNGDTDADKILEVVIRMARLIDVANQN